MKKFLSSSCLMAVLLLMTNSAFGQMPNPITIAQCDAGWGCQDDYTNRDIWSWTVNDDSYSQIGSPNAFQWKFNGGDNNDEVMMQASPEYLTLFTPSTGTWSKSLSISSTFNGSRQFWEIKCQPSSGADRWHNLYFNGYQGSAMVLDYYNKRVGIGTDVPDFKLDVVGRARIKANGTGPDQTAGIWYSNSAGTFNRVFIGMKNDNEIGFYNAGSSGNPAGWGVTLSANAGILYMNGKDLRFKGYDDGNNYINWSPDIDGLEFGAKQDFRFKSTSSSKILMRMKSNGRVGIGTEDPKADLEVNGSVLSPVLFSERTVNNYKHKGYVGFYYSVAPTADYALGGGSISTSGGFDGDYLLGTPTKTPIVFVTNNVRRMAIDTIGNVKIGGAMTSATTPAWLVANGGAKLSVNGQIVSTGIRCTTNGWADHVFEDTYSLAPLEEVKSYIDEHKHLPGIPSAANIEQEGLNLPDMAKMQMAKIEELTLYLLEQNKQMLEQNKQMQQLKAEVERLNSEIKDLKH